MPLLRARPDPMEVKQYTATGCCILCRHVIFEAFGVEFGCVVQLNQRCALLESLQWHGSEVDVYLEDGTHITISCREELPDQAHCYHSSCWEFVKTIKEVVTPEQLLNFAQSSMRLYDLPVRPSFDPACVKVISPYWLLESLTPSNFELGKMLQQIRDLPPELYVFVLEFARPSPASSLLDMEFHGTFDLLSRAVPSSYEEEKCTITRCMKFHFVTIEGSSYWCGCEHDKGIIGYKGEGKPIVAEIPQDATVLRFTVGRFGIRGLQFQGRSRASEFIGECGKRLWTGEMTSSKSFEHLMLGLDGLKIRTVDIRNRQNSFGQQFLWEGQIPLSTTVAIKRKAYYQKSSWSSTKLKVDGFPGWQLMRYLPLMKKGSVLYGLTVYCATAGGITGFESHFRSYGVTSASRIGHTRVGCAIHFRLVESEYFDSAWVLCDKNAYIWGPFLKFHTSENRTACFRPLLSEKLTLKLLHKGKISGLYCDALRESSQMLQTIGIMCDPNQLVCNSNQTIMHQDSPKKYSTNLAAPLSGTFGSRILIKDIAAIEACYIGDRCTGLAFTLAMCRVEILGQWFECTGRHSLLFNRASDEDLKGLRFQLHGTSHIAVVCNVTILDAESDISVEGTFKDAKCFDTVEWIFSEAADEICVQQGIAV